MFTKPIKKFVAVAFMFSVTTGYALEPLKENRARLSDLHGTILLPDYSYLEFDMSLDCGSKWENTGMIITSKAGAQLLAASYTHMWGVKAGEMVMQQWKNKVSLDDPRLPTFLVVTPPEGASFDWKTSIKVASKDRKFRNKSSSSTANISMKMAMPMIIGTCGTRSHSD